MNKLRGFTEVVIGGKKRPVKFGTNQTIIFCQHRGITLKDYADLFSADKIKDMAVDGSETRDLLWSGLADGARYKNQKFEATPETIGDWIDDADENIMVEAFSAMLSRVTDNNTKKK